MKCGLWEFVYRCESFLAIPDDIPVFIVNVNTSYVHKEHASITSKPYFALDPHSYEYREIQKGKCYVDTKPSIDALRLFLKTAAKALFPRSGIPFAKIVTTVWKQVPRVSFASACNLENLKSD